MKKILCSAISASMMFAGCGINIVSADDKTEIVSANLLSNPGFETELLGSGEWKFANQGGWYNESDVVAAQTTEQIHSGEKAAKLQKATFGQRVTLTAGKTYRLTAYVKADSETSSPDMGFYDGAQEYPSSNSVKITDVKATSDWQEVTVDLECTESKDYVICLMTWDDSVSVYFDDVSLYEIKLPFESGGIANGDFSDNSAWTITGAGAVSGGAFSVSGNGYESRISQTVTGIENGVYDITAYVTSSDVSGTAYLYAKTEGHTMASTALPQTDSAMKITVPGVIVDNGSCDIGLYAAGSSSVTLDNVSMSPSENTRVDLLKGGEISKLTYVEDNGAKFYFEDGTEGDALQIMAENGFNLARIRLLDDPGKGHGDGEYYLPEGYMTEEDCLRLARRAKDKGMKICFTFAYSDYWVDGEKQMVPYAWQQEITAQGLKGESLVSYLEDKVYSYTADVMKKLIAQGTQPEYVSVGNEIQVGMLFNKQSSNNGLYNNASYLARLLSAGAKAVRETSPETDIIFHSDNGGNLYRRSTFINALRTVDDSLYDVIGVSYYPFYNATYSIDTVVNDFNGVINEFDKDVIIMETGYNWSELRGDGWEGQLKDSGYYQNIYGETQNGQRAFLTELYAKLKQVAGGRCIGDMYWDPVMVYDGGSYKIGWAISEDGDWTKENLVSNSTIFDFNGREVTGQKAMKYNTNANDNVNITGTVSDKNGMLSEKELTFTVNGTEYIVSTDKFGKYIVSVPYPADEKFEISMTGSDKTYACDAPYDGIFIKNIDFNAETDVDDPVKPTSTPTDTPTAAPTDAPTDTPITDKMDVSVQVFENGISYSVDVPENVSGTLYAALFAGSGKLVGIKQNTAEGSFDELSGGEYKIKAFIWNDDMSPETEYAEGSCSL